MAIVIGLLLYESVALDICGLPVSGKLIVPRYRLNSFGRRCFAVAGPSTWNLLPDSLRDPALSLNIFRRQLKTHFFCEILTSLCKN